MTDDEEKTTNGASSYRDMSEPIKRFQREAGLPETGEMNEETIKTMRLPRCGMTEKTFRDQRRMRKKRFTVAGLYLFTFIGELTRFRNLFPME